MLVFICLPFAFWFSLAFVGPVVTSWCLNLLRACKAFAHHWMTGFSLAQTADVWFSSWVLLDP